MFITRYVCRAVYVKLHVANEHRFERSDDWIILRKFITYLSKCLLGGHGKVHGTDLVLMTCCE